MSQQSYWNNPLDHFTFQGGDNNAQNINLHLLPNSPTINIPLSNEKSFVSKQHFPYQSLTSSKECAQQINSGLKQHQCSILESLNKEPIAQSRIYQQDGSINQEQFLQVEPPSNYFPLNNFLPNNSIISFIPPSSQSSALKLSESQRSSNLNGNRIHQGEQIQGFNQSQSSVNSRAIENSIIESMNQSKKINTLSTYENQKNKERHPYSNKLSPRGSPQTIQKYKMNDLCRTALKKSISQNYLVSKRQISSDSAKESKIQPKKQDQFYQEVNHLTSVENEKSHSQILSNNSHSKILTAKKQKHEFQPLHSAPHMPSVLGRSKINTKKIVSNKVQQDSSSDAAQASKINLTQEASENKSNHSLSRYGEKMSDYLTPTRLENKLLSSSPQEYSMSSCKEACINHLERTGRHYFGKGQQQNLCDECICITEYNQKQQQQQEQKEYEKNEILQHQFNYQQSCQRKKESIDTYSSNVAQIIPIFTSSLESMYKKQGDVDKFLSCQGRLIEENYENLEKAIIQTKQQLLQALNTCKEEINRRYEEANQQCKQSLTLLLNSQQDIEINYQNIICEFEESQVNLVMQAYQERFVSAQIALNKIGRKQLLGVLKFDLNPIQSLKGQLHLAAMTSLKRLLTTYTKSNSNNNSNNNNKQELNERQSLRNAQQEGKLNNSPNFRIRKNNSEHSKRLPVNELTIQGMRKFNQVNHLIQVDSQENFCSATENSSLSPMNSKNDNSSFFSYLDGSFQSNRGPSQDEKVNKQANQLINNRKPVYISFDNKEAFKNMIENENKENNCYNNIPLNLLGNSSFGPSQNIQYISNNNAQFQISSNINQSRQQQQNDLAFTERVINNSNENNHFRSSYLSSQEQSEIQKIQEIVESEEKQKQSSHPNQVVNEVDYCNNNQKNIANSDKMIPQKESQDTSLQQISIYHQKLSEYPNKSTTQENMLSSSNAFILKEDRINVQQQYQQKFNDMLKTVTANQIQRNQNCQAIMKQVQENAPEVESTNSCSSANSHQQSVSTQNSITAGGINGSNRFLRGLSCYSKIPAETYQDKSTFQEKSKPMDNLSKGKCRYQSTISEESERCHQVETQNSELQLAAIPKQYSDSIPRFIYDFSVANDF